MNTKKMVKLSLMVSLAVVLSLLENQFMLPSLPWLRIGLANIITLLALMTYGISSAIAVSCIRSLLAGIFGNFVMLIFSFPSALISSFAMGIFYYISHEKLSIIGISVIGALIHNITQLLIAYFVLRITIRSLLFILPFLIISALIAGIITGFMARYIYKRVNIQN